MKITFGFFSTFIVSSLFLFQEYIFPTHIQLTSGLSRTVSFKYRDNPKPIDNSSNHTNKTINGTDQNKTPNNTPDKPPIDDKPPKGNDSKPDPDPNRKPPKDPNDKPKGPTREQVVVNCLGKECDKKQIIMSTKYIAHRTDYLGTSAFLQNGGVVSSKNHKHIFLCEMSLSKLCESIEPAEIVDRFVIFIPRYYIHQDVEPMMTMYHNYFLGYVNSIGLKTCVIEAIVESRKQHYALTKPNNLPYEIQVKIEDTFFIRENLVNVAAKKIQDSWDYLVWIDAHHHFDNSYWWEEAIWKMEHHSSVQFFKHIARMNEFNDTIGGLDLQGTMYIYSYQRPYHGTEVWAGNAWGIRKEMYEKIEYILDTCISGACDYSFSLASMKNPNDWNGIDGFPAYKAELWPWITRTSEIFKGNFAYIKGFGRHFCHEHFFDYFGFQRLFANGGFRISEDLRRDDDFMLHLANPRMKEIFSHM